MTMLAKHPGCVRNKNVLLTVDSLVRTTDRDKITCTRSASIDRAKRNRASNLNHRIRNPDAQIKDSSKFRQHKISVIRRQLQLGEYEVEARFTEILDRVIEDIVA